MRIPCWDACLGRKEGKGWVSRIREGVELMLFLCGCWGAAFSFHCELPPVVEDTYDSVITVITAFAFFSQGKMEE